MKKEDVKIIKPGFGLYSSYFSNIIGAKLVKDILKSVVVFYNISTNNHEFMG